MKLCACTPPSATRPGTTPTFIIWRKIQGSLNCCIPILVGIFHRRRLPSTTRLISRVESVPWKQDQKSCPQGRLRVNGPCGSLLLVAVRDFLLFSRD